MIRTTFFMLFGLLSATAAMAHGPQIQITNDTGKIVTREALHGTYSPLASAVDAYVTPVSRVEDIDFPAAWRLDGGAPFGPGLAYGLGATFPTNSTLSISFLDELKTWNGSAFVSAGATELAALRTSNPNGSSLAGNAGISGTADPTAEIEIGDSYTENAHASVTWVLLGDGADPASAVADGVYLASLQVSSSEASIADSDPFYLVLNKGPAGDLVQAVTSLGVDAQYIGIPEPTSAVLAGLLCLFGAGFRRS